MQLYNKQWKEFTADLQETRVLTVCDVNTAAFRAEIVSCLAAAGKTVEGYCFPDKHLVPEIGYLSSLIEQAKGFEYLLGIGSGVINDICKYVAVAVRIPYGILATAPSMDGYVSGVSALYDGGKKVTVSTCIPREVLIDIDVLKAAPIDMIAAGAGDLIGKYTSLLDWKLAHCLIGERYDGQIAERMSRALELCMREAEYVTARKESAIHALTQGLILSGVEMQNAGNSRPASGSEHHVSHYLEMAGEKAGIDFAPHGVKVALGCLVSVMLYRYAAERYPSELKPIADDIAGLPTVDGLRALYRRIGLPDRFSAIGVSRELLEQTVERAYTVRERYTIMRFLQEKGELKNVAPVVADNLA